MNLFLLFIFWSFASLCFADGCFVSRGYFEPSSAPTHEIIKIRLKSPNQSLIISEWRLRYLKHFEVTSLSKAQVNDAKQRVSTSIRRDWRIAKYAFISQVQTKVKPESSWKLERECVFQGYGVISFHNGKQVHFFKWQ